MIKLFQKTRYDLMRKNNTKKYLKYALGEIALVVIGTLIALQLNNYNETLNQNNIEQNALDNLKLDFDYNKLELNKSIEETKKTINTGHTILNQTGNKREKTFEIDNLLEEAPVISQYFHQNGFLMDLINSGNLGIINNNELRYRLSSWLPSLATLKDVEDRVSIDNHKFMQFINKTAVG
ncbi:MAG: hypothetical protein ACJAWA_001170 [Nonlabens sp.]|jgi:hypothetical protein